MCEIKFTLFCVCEEDDFTRLCVCVCVSVPVSVSAIRVTLDVFLFIC